jgi:hypothetical protein
MEGDKESTRLRVGSGMWINALRGLSGKLKKRRMRIRKGMIGLERGGGRVIGNYGMRRESSISLFVVVTFLLPAFWLLTPDMVGEMDGLVESTDLSSYTYLDGD